MIECDYLIIGGGVGAAVVSETIRKFDRRASVMLVGREPHLPYHRNQLLAALFGKGSSDPASLAYRNLDWYEKNRIDLRLSNSVEQFNLERRIAVLASGQAVQFKKACLATGSKARRPAVAGANLGNVFCLRTMRDVAALREIVETEKEIVVIGGGTVATEAAAMLRQARIKVTLMCGSKFLWQSRLDEETAEWLTKQIEGHGVSLMMGEMLNGFEGKTVIRNVQTKSGARVSAGVAVLALGADPNMELVLGTPLSSPHGIPVNEYLETDEKGIFSVGDPTYFPDRLTKTMRRTTNWENAVEQAKIAGANITGKKRQKFESVPVHTSEIFDLRIRLVGDFRRPPEAVEIEGERARKRFIARYSEAGKPCAAVLVNQDAPALEAAIRLIRPALAAG
jgi:NAD(P)H-nitrite reductase large subunit